MTPRMAELAEAAAEALEDARDPLDRGFLIEHEVTLDEAGALADMMAAGLRTLMLVLPRPREGRCSHT